MKTPVKVWRCTECDSQKSRGRRGTECEHIGRRAFLNRREAQLRGEVVCRADGEPGFVGRTELHFEAI